MGKVLFVLLVFSLVLAGLASAASITITEPVNQMLSPAQDVDLGVVGPGQKVEVVAKRATGEKDITNVQGGEALWDRLESLNLPAGWSSEPSDYYESPMHAFVVVAPYAADGEYSFTMRATDQYQGATDLLFNPRVRISRDVLDVRLQSARVETGPGQPASFYVDVWNTGSASDLFSIDVLGLPNSWKSSRQVFVPLKSLKTFPIEVTPTESGEFSFTVKVTSLSSNAITQSRDATVVSQASLLNDLKAASNGLLLFPSVQQTIYSFLGFVASYFN